jgi:hypothetical protein
VLAAAFRGDFRIGAAENRIEGARDHFDRARF